MRIAFLLGQFPALSETFILNQITTLIERRHDVSIFAERPSFDDEEHPDVMHFDLRRRTRYESMPDDFARRALRLSTVWTSDRIHLRALNVMRYGRQAASLRLAWSAGLFHGTGDFDIIQCHFGALGLKAVLLRDIGALRGKIVTAFHGEDITGYPRRFSGNVYAPLFADGDLFLPISSRWNDALIALGCPPDRIRVHRMGVDVRRFSARSRTATPDAPVRVITVGRLVEKKGVDDAIRAVARMPTACEYVVVGDGPCRARLEALARSLGVAANVHFVGAQSGPEVSRLLQSADIFLAPSVTGTDGDIEGLPVSIMEAMASGLPVVSTRHSGIPELIVHDSSGLMVEEHDVAELARSLSALAEDHDRRMTMGSAGREIIAREFDIEKLTEQLEQRYRDVLTGGP